MKEVYFCVIISFLIADLYIKALFIGGAWLCVCVRTLLFCLLSLFCLSLENYLLTRRDRCGTGREKSLGKSNEQIWLFQIDLCTVCSRAPLHGDIKHMLGCFSFFNFVTLYPFKSCCQHLVCNVLLLYRKTPFFKLSSFFHPLSSPLNLTTTGFSAAYEQRYAKI